MAGGMMTPENKKPLPAGFTVQIMSIVVVSDDGQVLRKTLWHEPTQLVWHIGGAGGDEW